MANLRLGVDLKGESRERALVSALEALLGTGATGIVTDDDNAASTGTAVEVVPHIDGTGAGYLASINAGAADAEFHLGEGGPVVNVQYEAAPAGVQLYFNQALSRFEAVVVANANTYVLAEDGTRVIIYDNDDAATDGVAVYFDDDGADEHARLLFVSASNTDGSFGTAVTPVSLAEPTARAVFRQTSDGSLELSIEAI